MTNEDISGYEDIIGNAGSSKPPQTSGTSEDISGYEDLIPKQHIGSKTPAPIDHPENFLQKISRAVQQTGQLVGAPKIFSDAISGKYTGAASPEGMAGLGPYQMAHDVKSNMLTNSIKNKWLSVPADIATNPETWMGFWGGAKAVGEGVGEGAKETGKLFRTPNVMEERMGNITSRASREEEALKGYQGFRTDQIKSEGNKLIDSAVKQAQAGKVAQMGPTEDAIPGIQAEISKLSQGANVLEKQTLPKVAWQSGQKASENMRNIISKQGNKWNQDLESLLGGKETDTMIDPSKVTASLEKTLSDNGVNIFTDENGVMQASRPLSTGEKKILDLRNSIANRGSGEGATGYGVREMLREKRLLGQSVNYGKQWTQDDYLLNQARHGIASASEDVVPGLKEHNATWAPWSDLKEGMVKNFDLYGGKYSEAGRPFIQKEVTSGLTPAQQSLAGDIKTKIGDYSKPAQQVASGIAEKQSRIKGLQATLSDLQERVKSGSSLSPAEEQSIRQQFQQHIDSEIQNVKDITQKEIVGLQNKTGMATERLSAIRDTANKKIAHLKAIGALTVTGGGIFAGAVGLLKLGGLISHVVSGQPITESQ